MCGREEGVSVCRWSLSPGGAHAVERGTRAWVVGRPGVPSQRRPIGCAGALTKEERCGWAPGTAWVTWGWCP